MSKTVLLVTGAGGNTGKPVALHLLKKADKSKYIIRVSAKKQEDVKDLVDQGAEFVSIDFMDQKSLHDGLKGADRIWATPPNPAKDSKQGDRMIPLNNIVAAAKDVGVNFIVMGSAFGAELRNTNFAREFRDGEVNIEKSGLSYAFLRMVMFQENLLGQKDSLLKGSFTEPLGSGAFPPVSVEDVGEAAAEILLNPERHHNKAYEFTGPEDLTGDQKAAELSKALGRQVKYIPATKEDALKSFREIYPEHQAIGVLQLFEMCESGKVRVTSAFKDITGKRGTTVQERFSQLKQTGALDSTPA
jgi:uncharacterized protein YbjT (DUF2867 family)